MQNKRNASCGASPAVGMVSGAMQQIYEVYPAQTAIRRGTLYPELDKPMNCASAPSGCAQPSQTQQDGFTTWELRLYLDTHPCDPNALAFFQQMCQQSAQPNYACAFVPCAENWKWIDDPWPWELCANDRRA